MEIIESYAVPWALRGEEIPIHLRWKSGEEFDSIRVHIPSDFIVRDLMNIRNCDSGGQVLVIDELAEDGYFGLAISSDNLFKSQTVSKEILIEFLQNNQIKHEERVAIRMFRPFVKVLDYTQKLVLTDDSEKSNSEKISIRLKYTGFGDAFIGIRTKIGGVWRNTGEKFYYQLMRLLLDKYETPERVLKTNITEVLEDTGKSRVIDDSGAEVVYEREMLVEDLKRYLERYVYKKSLSLNGLDDVDFDDIKRLLDSLKEKLSDKTYADEFYKHLSAVVFEVLINSLKRNPADNVYLRDSDNAAFIERTIKSFSVQVAYKDALGNEYESIELIVEVEDHRTNKNSITIPIELNITSEVIDAIRCEIDG